MGCAGEMFADTGTWEDVTVAAAFCLGMLFGGYAVVHVTRNAIDYLRNDRHKHDDDEAQ